MNLSAKDYLQPSGHNPCIIKDLLLFVIGCIVLAAINLYSKTFEAVFN